MAHYRHLLLQRLQQDGQHVVAISPVDSSTPELSRLLIHIPWRIHRSTDANPFFFGISFLRMLFLVRAIKPRLVHSHTLKANLLAAVVTAIFGIPCVLSFAGMGRLSKARGPSRLAFVFVLRSIAFFSVRQRRSRWRWGTAPDRTAFIFQNPIDRSLFEAALPHLSTSRNYLIPGSGVPGAYLAPTAGAHNSVNDLPNHWWSQPLGPRHCTVPTCELLFCGRLLRSKGIVTFLEVADLLAAQHFTVFGGIDPSSRDSLLSAELPDLQRQHPNVVFSGSQRDPLLHLKVPYPVLVVPSNYGEGMPRSVAEALVLGIPVISSRAATCGIFDASTVYIAEDDDPGDYLHCFDQLLADHAAGQLLTRLQAGRHLVHHRFSEEAVVAQTLAVYESLHSERIKSYLLNKDDARLQHWLAQ
ncbi:glycosyl transferases group 1 family protein [Synechococcus sp. A15-127]|nr:glycosyl transferases group 1 family protein [Synechococcus sp. A15-127]